MSGIDNDALGRMLHNLECPDDESFWTELTERERLDYRTRGAEMATASEPVTATSTPMEG